MRIAIVGAGISGLTAAAGLQSDGHEVLVYERRADPSAIGAGLTLFKNTFTAFDALGFGDAVRGASGGDIASMRAGQRLPSGSWLATVPPSAVAPLRSIHRADLHRVLSEKLAPGTLRLANDARVAEDGAPVVTAGQHAETFDLVVVADGIRSSNRALLGLDTGIRYAGYTAWRGVTSHAVNVRGEAGETWGQGQLFGIVPLPDGRVYWFGTLSTNAGARFADEKQAALETFAGWHAPIATCIDATATDAVMRHDIYDLAAPLSSFTRGHTVLMGDAAHAMTPNLGQGAGQGIEDAATLVVLLRGASTSSLPHVLARYNALRMKRTQMIWRRSRMVGRIAQASHPVAASLRNTAVRVTPGAVLAAASRQLQAWELPQG